MAEIQSVSIKHEMIMDYLMAHPNIRLGDVAASFGITQPWLSQVIHSDAFQLKLREKQGIAFHHTVLPIREKMLAVAHQALDKIAEQLPMETNVKTLNDVAENVLDRLGYGSKGVATSVQVTNNTQINVLRDELEEARELLYKKRTNSVEVVIDGISAPIALPVQNTPTMGEAGEGAALSTPEAEWQESSSGGEV